MVLYPGVPATDELGQGISLGDKVELRRTDGSVFQTVVAKLMPARGDNPDQQTFPVVVLIDSAAAVPKGTDVWVEDGKGK